MRKKRRQKYCLIVAALFAAALLGGCGRAGRDVEKLMGNEEKYSYITLYSDVNFWEPPVWDTSDASVTGQITQRTGVVPDVTVPVQDTRTRLSLMLVNDRLPDLISVTDERLIGQLTSSGKVWELQEFLERYCPDSHILKEFPEDIKEELIQRDGGWYALPSHMNSDDARAYWKPCDQLYVDYERCGSNNGILWNRSLLEKLGLSVEELQTEEQVLAAFRKARGMQAGGRDLIPLLVDGDSYQQTTLPWLMSTFGAEYVDGNGDYTDPFLQEETLHALRFLNEALREGYMDSEQLTWSNSEVTRSMNGGNVLCFIGSMANVDVDFSQWVSSGALLSAKGKCPVLGKNGSYKRIWISTFISRDCQEPEKVAAWLDYMTSEEGMLFWQYGVEEEDYRINEQGLVERTAQGKGKLNNSAETGMGIWWMFENTAWIRSVEQPPREGSAAAQKLEAFVAYGKDPHTVLYDNYAQLRAEDCILPGTGIGEMAEKLDACKSDWTLQLLLAEDEARFWELCQEMQGELRKEGMSLVNRTRNRVFQELCRERGSMPEKINKEVLSHD